MKDQQILEASVFLESLHMSLCEACYTSISLRKIFT